MSGKWNNGLHNVYNVTFAAAGLLNILSVRGNLGKFDQHAGNMEFNTHDVYVQLYA